MKNGYHKTAQTFFKVTILALLVLLTGCHSAQNAAPSAQEKADRIATPVPDSSASAVIRPGIYQTGMYFPLLRGKRIAIVGNQTSMKDSVHLVDLLLQNGFDVVKVFAPEHGFRGDHDAGETVENGRDARTGLPIISLYGKHKKPTPQDLADVDVILFDIQDVGARFYTYLSTLHYVMEAAAENRLPVIVLDRPNPHIDEIDGPVMEEKYRSFVGLHPVPILYGMTIGEYARMINGEGWLKDSLRARLTVIPIRPYNHHTPYTLPVKPSPNLPNQQAVMLYPSLCLFEPTDVSVGRGTDWPFQVYGAPALCPSDFRFVPRPNAGAKYPKHQGDTCCGRDLRRITPPKGIYLDWILDAYRRYADKDIFFKKYFERIAGTDRLRRQIEAGLSAGEIKVTWQADLDKFRRIRKKYLIYPE